MRLNNVFSADIFTDYDAVLVGSPCRFGGVSAKLGIAPVIKKMLLALPDGSLAGKKCGGFEIHFGAGEEHAVTNIGKAVVQKAVLIIFPAPLPQQVHH